jgi:serine/threonine protein kinase
MKTEPPVKVTDPLVGTLIDGRYLVQSVLGRGGMGVVYAGLHEKLGRSVAIKVLGMGVAGDPVAVKRFLREARTASQLTHGNIVDVSDLGQLPDGRPYLVMAKMEGEDFAVVLNKYGPRTPKRTAELLAGAAAALDLIHAKGYVHRDVKPENLMHVVRADGSEATLLLDFGIVGLVSSQASRLTAEGSVFGTPAYLPPEVIQGAAPHPRGDVYALATVAFELMAGRAPFEADNPLRILPMKIMNDAPRMGTTSGLWFSDEVESVVARGLTRDPEHRWATAGEFVDALAAAAALDEQDGEVIRVPSSAHPADTPSAPKAGYTASQPRSHTETGARVRTPPRIDDWPSSAESLPPLSPPIAPISGGSPTLSIEFQAMRSRDRRSLLGWGIVGGLLIGGSIVGGSLLLGAPDPQPRGVSLADEHATPGKLQPAAAGSPTSRLAPEPSPTAPPAEAAASAKPQPTTPEALRAAAPSATPAAESAAPAPRATKPGSARGSRDPARGHAEAASVHKPQPTAAPPPASAPARGPSAQALVQAATRELTQGHLGAAADFYAEASRVDPQSEAAFRGLGLTNERLGRKAEAIRAFRRALALAPNGNNADMLRARLAKLEAAQ